MKLIHLPANSTEVCQGELQALICARKDYCLSVCLSVLWELSTIPLALPLWNDSFTFPIHVSSLVTYLLLHYNLYSLINFTPVCPNITSKPLHCEPERHRRQTATNVTAENVKSSSLIHLAHYFYPFFLKVHITDTRLPATVGFLTRFWMYIILSGLYGLITASSSQRRQTFTPSSPLLPSGLPPFL